jgi:hypothetical protein
MRKTNSHDHRPSQPQHFRFVEQDGEARLNLHDDRAGEYKGVHILVEYRNSREAYSNLPLDWESIGPFMAWWDREDEKPF